MWTQDTMLICIAGEEKYPETLQAIKHIRETIQDGKK